MGLGVQKVRIEKVETNVNFKIKIFYVSLTLKFQNKPSIEIDFYEGDTIYSLYQIMELYFGSIRSRNINELWGKDLLILQGKNPGDIAFSVPRHSGLSNSYGYGKWVILGSYDNIYSELEAKELLESKS